MDSEDHLPENPDHECFAIADTACYLLDDFDRVVAKPAYSASGDGGAWSVKSGHIARDWQTKAREDEDFAFSDMLVVWGEVESYVGSGYDPHTSLPAWASCGIGENAFSGWKETEVWYKYTVPVHPTSMAGFTVPLAATSKGGVASTYGYLARVTTTEPSDLQQGTVLGTWLGSSSTFFVPGSVVPDAGGTIYIGITPAWHANFGNYVCGFNWPRNTGQENSGYAHTPGSASIPSPAWQSWDASATDWGAGLAGDDTGSWWEGRLPWVMSGTGMESAEMDGASLKLTVASGSNLSLVARMDGDSVFQPPDSDTDEQYGSAWIHDNGVAVAMRFRITTAGVVADAGTRHLYMEWADGRDVLRATINLGDPQNAEGLTVSDDTNTTTILKAVTEGSWMWLKMDTRNADHLRAKMWVESSLLGSGEIATWDVDITRSADTEVPVNNDYFEIGMMAGNAAGDAQVIEVERVVVCGPADANCQWVIEKIGEGSTTEVITFTTSMPYKQGSLWFFVDGVHVRTKRVSVTDGTFRGIGGGIPDANAVLVVRYLYEYGILG